MQTKNKPFYKKGWFIAIMFILILTVLVIVKENEIIKLKNKLFPAEPAPDYTIERGYELIEKKKKNIYEIVDYFIEENEMKKIKTTFFFYEPDYKIDVYSETPISDKNNNSYPISFLVRGRYEEKGSHDLNDFNMIIAFKSEQQLDESIAYLLKYENEQTETYFNVLDE